MSPVMSSRADKLVGIYRDRLGDARRHTASAGKALERGGLDAARLDLEDALAAAGDAARALARFAEVTGIPRPEEAP